MVGKIIKYYLNRIYFGGVYIKEILVVDYWLCYIIGFLLKWRD